MVEKIIDLLYLRIIENKYRYMPWIILFIYMISYPFFHDKVYAFGSFILVPTIAFGLQGKKYGLIMGMMFLPINTLLQLYSTKSNPSQIIINLIIPWLLLIFLGYIVGTVTELSRDKTHLINRLKQQQLEINQLQDLIPVCMYCKDIKDSSGYWRQVDNYIQQNTNSQISHGICDSCYEVMNIQYSQDKFKLQ